MSGPLSDSHAIRLLSNMSNYLTAEYPMLPCAYSVLMEFCWYRFSTSNEFQAESSLILIVFEYQESSLFVRGNLIAPAMASVWWCHTSCPDVDASLAVFDEPCCKCSSEAVRNVELIERAIDDPGYPGKLIKMVDVSDLLYCLCQHHVLRFIIHVLNLSNARLFQNQ